MTDPLTRLLASQDGVITRQQALGLMTEEALRHRLRRGWQILLPGVYLTVTGAPTERQRLRAAILYGGRTAQLADITALRSYAVRYLPSDRTTRLLLAAEVRRANRDSVTVRRTYRLPAPRLRDGLPVSPPERALVDFAARSGDRRTAIAVIADAVERGIARTELLRVELSHLTGRGAGCARDAVTEVVGGVRSAPEFDVLTMCRSSAILPAPELNSLLLLPCGRRVSPDALWEDAGLVHETNGRAFHAGEDPFDDMQERHDAMTAAGLTVLHSSPRQISESHARLLTQLESCYQRGKGVGMPPGVVIERRGPGST